MRKHRDISGAIFLIFLGTIFLLNTTGVVDWGIWLYLLRFWPIFIILGGIKIILGKNFIAEIIVSIISLLLFTIIGITSFIAYKGAESSFLPKAMHNCIVNDCLNFWGDAPGEKITQTKYVEIEEGETYESRDLIFDIGAAEFTMADDQLEKKHISGELTYYEGYREPFFTSEVVEESLRIVFDTDNTNTFGIYPNYSVNYDLTVSPMGEMKDNVSLDLGAGSGDITLNELNVNNIDANIGAGSLTLSLSDKSIPQGDITLDIGAGEMILNIPEEVGYTISYDLGVGEISSNGESIAQFAGSAENYKSSNYDNTQTHINIIANVGVGSLKINNN